MSDNGDMVEQAPGLAGVRMDGVVVSFVIVTHNRREALLKTLGNLYRDTPGPAELGGGFEVWVVDNASTDGTEAAVWAAYPGVNYLMRQTNEGVWARSVAFGPARGEFVVLLDDDSYPVGDAVLRSIGHLRRRPKCAAVVGKVLLPDGTGEGCAMPGVMLSGAVCIRRSVLLGREEGGGGGVGGFRPEFFRKAGEYDLSYRIWAAGWTVERLEDVVYRHDKVMTGRSKPFAHRMDLRNNLILVERYLPRRLRPIYRADVAQRYGALAREAGRDCVWAARQARLEGALWRVRERAMELLGRGQTLSDEVVETLYQHEAQAAAVARWALRTPVRKVVIADFSKNLYATFQACERARVRILGIADDGRAFAGLKYRGVPVVPVAEAAKWGADGWVLSNVNPAQVEPKLEKVQAIYSGPVLRLWEPEYSEQPAADEQVVWRKAG